MTTSETTTPAEKLDFKRVLPILVIVLVDLMGLSIIVPLLPLFAARFGATPFVIGWAGNSMFGSMDRGLASGFAGLMDLQVLLGLIYFIWNGLTAAGFPAYRILHLVIMFFAAVFAHLPSRFRNLNDKLRFGYSAFAIVASIVLIVVGISAIPGGWSR